VNAKRPDLTIESFDGISRHDTTTTKQLNGSIDYTLRSLRRIHLRHRRLTRHTLGAIVTSPCRAIDEKRAGIDLGCHVGNRGLSQLKVRELAAEHLPIAYVR